MYHQITELYFKLALHECKQIAENEHLTADFFAARVKRINSYFGALTQSFAIMVDGMEKEQFLQFRMSLLPASGFQSGQYRMIEIYATDFINLVDKGKREELRSAPMEISGSRTFNPSIAHGGCVKSPERKRNATTGRTMVQRWSKMVLDFFGLATGQRSSAGTRVYPLLTLSRG